MSHYKLSLPLFAFASGCFTTEPYWEPSEYETVSYEVTADEPLVIGSTVRELLALANVGEPIALDTWVPSEPQTFGGALTLSVEPKLDQPIAVTEVWSTSGAEHQLLSVTYELGLTTCGARLGDRVLLDTPNHLGLFVGWVAAPDDQAADQSAYEGVIFPATGVHVDCGTYSYWPQFIAPDLPADVMNELVSAAPTQVNTDTLQWKSWGSWQLDDARTASQFVSAGLVFGFDDPSAPSPDPIANVPAYVSSLGGLAGWQPPGPE